MEEHYINDVGKITYVYGVNLEEHKTVIEKQQKRIAELEKQLDQQKSRWNELKESLSFTQPKNINDEFISGACAAYSYVKDKMRELEGEDDN